MDEFDTEAARLCFTLDGDEDKCVPLDEPELASYGGVPPGCHSLTVTLRSSSSLLPAPTGRSVFQVVDPRVGYCSEALTACPVEDIRPPNTQYRRTEDAPGTRLQIATPRPGDVVFSPHVVLNMFVSVPNGTRVSPQGSLCITATLEGGGRSSSTTCFEASGDSMFFDYRFDQLLLAPLSSSSPVRLDARLTVAEGWFDAQCIDPSSVLSGGEMGGTVATSVVLEAGLDFSVVANFSASRDDIRGALALGLPGQNLTAEALVASKRPLWTVPLVLVLCHWSEDLSWLPSQPFPYVVYEKRPPLNGGRHGVPFNTAGEASAFLKFIVDYYDELPVRMLFLHGHRYAYHQEDLLILLHRIRYHDVDYCNINQVIWGSREDPDREWLRSQWHWLAPWLGPLPDAILDRCCAQFVVHRDNVRRHPRAFYEEALYRVSLARDRDESRKYGLLLEWLWHYIFGGPAVMPEMETMLGMVHDIDQAVLSERSECFVRPATSPAESWAESVAALSSAASERERAGRHHPPPEKELAGDFCWSRVADEYTTLTTEIDLLPPDPGAEVGERGGGGGGGRATFRLRAFDEEGVTDAVGAFCSAHSCSPEGTVALARLATETVRRLGLLARPTPPATTTTGTGTTIHSVNTSGLAPSERLVCTTGLKFRPKIAAEEEEEGGWKLSIGFALCEDESMPAALAAFCARYKCHTADWLPILGNVCGGGSGDGGGDDEDEDALSSPLDGRGLMRDTGLDCSGFPGDSNCPSSRAFVASLPHDPNAEGAPVHWTKRRLTFWANEMHLGPVGDFKYTLRHLIGHEKLHFVDQSLSSLCALHGTCARDLRALPGHDGYTLCPDPHATRRAFFEQYRGDDLMRSVDAFFCGHPPAVCELFLPFNKTIVAVISLPIEIGREHPERWESWVNALLRLEADPRSIVVANNEYHRRFVEYFTGLRLPLIPGFCGYANHHGRAYAPSRPQEFLVGGERNGESERHTAFIESARAALERRSPASLRHVKEVYKLFSFGDIARHPAIVNLPYQVSTMSYFEYYRMNIPLLFPTKRLAIELGLDERILWRFLPEPAGAGGLQRGQRRPSPNDEEDAEGVEYWIGLADFYSWPHIIYFDNAEELAEKLVVTDFPAVSAAMREHNRGVRERVREAWYEAFEDAFAAGGLTHHDIPSDFDEAMRERWHTLLARDLPHEIGCGAMRAMASFPAAGQEVQLPAY